MSFQTGLTKSQPLDKVLASDIMKLLYACEVYETLITDEITQLHDSGDDDTAVLLFQAAELVREAKNVVRREDFPVPQDVIRDTEKAASAFAEELSEALRESKNQF